MAFFLSQPCHLSLLASSLWVPRCQPQADRQMVKPALQRSFCRVSVPTKLIANNFVSTPPPVTAEPGKMCTFCMTLLRVRSPGRRNSLLSSRQVLGLACRRASPRALSLAAHRTPLRLRPALFFFFFFFFCVPQLYLRGSPLSGEIFAYVTVF